MLPADQKVAYTGFYHSARRNRILDEKTTVLVHLASAMSMACYP
jgi:hypothetical protein